jgi:hypothetical protein
VSEILGDLLFQMKLQFIVEPRCFRPTAKQRQYRHAESSENAHLRLLRG